MSQVERSQVAVEDLASEREQAIKQFVDFPDLFQITRVVKGLEIENSPWTRCVLLEKQGVFLEISLGSSGVRQTIGEPDHQLANTEIRIVQVEIITAAKHLGGITAEVTEVVLVVERPRCDLGSGRLPPHELKVFLVHGTVDRPEANVLEFAHQNFPDLTNLKNRADSGFSRGATIGNASYTTVATQADGNCTHAIQRNQVPEVFSRRGEINAPDPTKVPIGRELACSQAQQALAQARARKRSMYSCNRCRSSVD